MTSAPLATISPGGSMGLWKVLFKVSPESNEDNLLMDVLFDFYPKAKEDIID